MQLKAKNIIYYFSFSFALIIFPFLILNFLIPPTENKRFIEAFKYSTLQSNNIDPLYFQIDEISHLNDVRVLFVKLWMIFFISVAVFILFSLKYHIDIKKFVIFNIVAFGLTALLCSISFENVFVVFHQLAFPQGNWTFNPETSNLIKLFPQEFFVNFFRLAVVLYYSIQLLILSIINGTRKTKG